jgi:hypothetical protein
MTFAPSLGETFCKRKQRAHCQNLQGGNCEHAGRQGRAGQAGRVKGYYLQSWMRACKQTSRWLSIHLFFRLKTIFQTAKCAIGPKRI